MTDERVDLSYRDESTGEIELDARTIPLPKTVSVEAREALRNLVDQDGVPTNARHELPAADNVAAWIAIQEAVNAQYAASLSQMAGELEADVETVMVEDTILHVATPRRPFDDRRALIDFHGGAFVFGAGEACRTGTRRLADLHGVRCYGVDYRTPPKHSHPAALDDGMAAYRFVLEGHASERIAVLGRSAGGNLAAALLLRVRDEGLPMPSSLVLLSPELDLTETGDSFRTNRMIDVVLPGPLRSANLLYAGGADLADPYLSPLFGDLRDFPATFLQTGTRDLFLSNTVRMHRALRSAGVEADRHVFEAMPHGGFGGGTPEDRELDREVVRFVEANWGFLDPGKS